jgi:hypothetical protein
MLIILSRFQPESLVYCSPSNGARLEIITMVFNLRNADSSYWKKERKKEGMKKGGIKKEQARNNKRKKQEKGRN